MSRIFIPSSSGYRESTYDFLIKNEEDLEAFVELYCEDSSDYFEEGSLKVGWDSGTFEFRHEDKFTQGAYPDWETKTMYLRELKDPLKEKSLY